MARRNSKLVRVDLTVWQEVRRLLPNCSDPERSRRLWGNQLEKMEEKLTGIKRNKRGSALDLIYVLILMVIVGGVATIGYAALSKTNDAVQLSNTFDADSKSLMGANTNRYVDSFDGAFLMFFVFMCLGVFALAVLVRVHPIFLPFYFLGMIFIVILGGVGANIYDGIASNAAISTYADQFTFTGAILTYLPLLVGVVGSLLAIVMYKLWSDGQ